MQERHHISIGSTRLVIAGVVRFEQADGPARAVRTHDPEGSANGKVRPLAASNSSEAVTTSDRTAVEASAPDRRDASIFSERNPMHLHAITSRPGDKEPEPGAARSRSRRYAVVTARLVSALALLATGAIHIQQYYVADYRVIPTIGTLFLLNFIGATVLGVYLLVPARADAGRLRRLADALAALGGLGLAVTSLIALEVSEQTPLFGFMEHGYRLEILVAIIAEAVATIALVAFLALTQGAIGRVRGPRRSRGGPVRIVPAGSGSKP
jgi:hypothetical protein